jgi:hypothetical protein
MKAAGSSENSVQSTKLHYVIRQNYNKSFCHTVFLKYYTFLSSLKLKEMYSIYTAVLL